jgi:hypothetical protein
LNRSTIRPFFCLQWKFIFAEIYATYAKKLHACPFLVLYIKYVYNKLRMIYASGLTFSTLQCTGGLPPKDLISKMIPTCGKARYIGHVIKRGNLAAIGKDFEPSLSSIPLVLANHLASGDGVGVVSVPKSSENRFSI